MSEFNLPVEPAGCRDDLSLAKGLLFGFETGRLKQAYKETCQKCWSPREAFRRFSEYDRYRSVFVHEIWLWLYGCNPRKIHSLTSLAWEITHVINDNGRSTFCLNWSDHQQRVYLGDGLLEYLGLLKDGVSVIYGGKTVEQEGKPK